MVLDTDLKYKITKLKNTKLMHTYKNCTLICVLILIAACSSNAPSKDAKTVFTTRITDSGLKHFQLGFLRQRPVGPDIEIRKSSGRREYSARDRGDSRYKKVQKQLLALATKEIEQSEYCREGFWVLKNEADAINPYMRGECNDPATKADRNNFPDTLRNW